MALVDMTHENHRELLRDGVLVVSAWAPWCKGCDQLASMFAAAAERHPEATFARLNVDDEEVLMRELDIRQVPMILAWRDGIGIFRKAGSPPGSALDQIVVQAAALDMDKVRADRSHATN